MTRDQTDSCAFHAGELLAQSKAGLLEEARRVHPMVGPTFYSAVASLLARMQLLVIGAADEQGRLWATALTGPAGFLQVRDQLTLDIDAVPSPVDPLASVLGDTAGVGLIAIDFAGRRRIRVNGHAAPRPGGLLVTADQVYGNCPRYIQARTPLRLTAGSEPRELSRRTDLSPEQQWVIESSDTFFVATRAASGDADASHRGGNPGFVEVVSPSRLRWPDYNGNALLMTLGNMVEDPMAGLLFIDFRTGATLHVTGSTSIHWTPSDAQVRTGAERVVVFDITHVVEIAPGEAPVWSDPQPSRFNP